MRTRRFCVGGSRGCHRDHAAARNTVAALSDARPAENAGWDENEKSSEHFVK